MVTAILLVWSAPTALVPLRLPPPTSVNLAAPVRYTASARRDTDGDALDVGPKIVRRVGGREVTFSGTTDYPMVSAVRVGSDGSALVERTEPEGGAYTSTVWMAGREQPVTVENTDTAVTIYRDARNYAGIYYLERGTRNRPLSPAKSFGVVDGKMKPLGYGAVCYWDRSGDAALHVATDEKNVPTGMGEATGYWLRIVEHGRSYCFDRMRFVRRLADGTWICASIAADDGFSVDEKGGTPGLGTALLGASSPQQVVEFRGGRVLRVRRLPPGWRLAAAGDHGELLLRRPAADEEISGNGDVAIVKGTRLSPIHFSPPKSVISASWDATTGLSNGRFQLHCALEEKQFLVDLAPTRP